MHSGTPRAFREGPTLRQAHQPAEVPIFFTSASLALAYTSVLLGCLNSPFQSELLTNLVSWETQELEGGRVAAGDVLQTWTVAGEACTTALTRQHVTRGEVSRPACMQPCAAATAVLRAACRRASPGT